MVRSLLASWSWVWLLALLCLGTAEPAWARPVSFQVNVDTSSVAGTSGSFLFNLSATSPALSATATIDNLDIGGGTLGGVFFSQNVTGSPPGSTSLTFNDPTFGILDQDMTSFGNSFNFLLTLSGPALDMVSPNPVEFSLSFFDSMLNPILGNPNPPVSDAALLLRILPGMQVQVVGTGPTTTIQQVVPTPEPATLTMLGLSLAAAGGAYTWRRWRCARPSQLQD